MTKIRGKIELIEAGSGTIVGHCVLQDCFDLSRFSGEQLAEYAFQCHLVSDAKLLEKWNKAWFLLGVKRYDTPIPYKHPKGAVIWVKL